MTGKPRGPKSDKLWAEAVRMAVLREETCGDEKRKRLSIIADKVATLAMDGDLQAIKEIGDRLDGRPKQASEITGAEGGPVQVLIQRFANQAAE